MLKNVLLNYKLSLSICRKHLAAKRADTSELEDLISKLEIIINSIE